MSMRARLLFGRIVPLLSLLAWATLPLLSQSGAKNGEWRHYAADLGATKYSPLDQINRENVKDLRIAWRWKSENFGARPDYHLEATPLMVGGVLYTTAGFRRDVVAIDGATGETLWMFRNDEGSRGLRAPNRATSGRGVAYWTDGKGDERIIYVSAGYRLVALDAKTGRPIPGFGKDGIVDLYDDFDQPRPADGQVALTAVPTVVRDVVVVGVALNQVSVKGYVRGFDVRTGKRLWVFHTIPSPGEFGNETWEKDSWSYTGNTGSWGGVSADEELGYLYVPVETPTNDTYGGRRPGNGLFGESLVCLDARTGKRIWHFQLVHHGLWDYDTPTLPILADVTVNGRKRKIVAQVTKQAFTYVFDRVTGEPIWPIEERPVPQSDVPGEKTSPTQPFPTKPPAFDRQGLTLDDLIDFTPQLKAEAVKITSEYKLGPIFTPPIVAGTNGFRAVLTLPGAVGGTNWQGGALDPETGILYVASSINLGIFSVVKDPKDSTNYIGGGGGAAAAGTARAAAPAAGAAGGREGGGSIADRAFFDRMNQNVGIGPQGLPMVKPPWGRITAIDLNTGDHMWAVANGSTPDYVKNHPALQGVSLPRTGRPGRHGIMVTKTLLFAGEGSGLLAEPRGAGGPTFRAYDKKTGEIISELTLPANQSGVPMTYSINGKQYIVVAVGAQNHPAELVALTLP